MGERHLRVTFLTHYFPPEVGAPQARLFELARRLTDSGIEVTVVTGFPNYPTGVDTITTWLRQKTEAENIRINRAMVRNVLDALSPGGSVKHVVNVLHHVVLIIAVHVETPNLRAITIAQ